MPDNGWKNWVKMLEITTNENTILRKWITIDVCNSDLVVIIFKHCVQKTCIQYHRHQCILESNYGICVSSKMRIQSRTFAISLTVFILAWNCILKLSNTLYIYIHIIHVCFPFHMMKLLKDISLSEVRHPNCFILLKRLLHTALSEHLSI